jgi:hypothetical protein
MTCTYYRCSNLTGSPACGNKVTSMAYAYQNCSNLTGSPVCGDNVTTMTYTYQNCSNLTGSPACGEKVTGMAYTYQNCSNLTGSPVCGNKVTNMTYTYYNCSNLTGCPVCGDNVTSMDYTYYNWATSCNAYFYSSIVNLATSCFANKNKSKRINLYVPSNSITYTTVTNTTRSYSLVGAKITYTDAGTYQYNTTHNIYIYPVENVAAAAIANGDEEANANAGITID